MRTALEVARRCLCLEVLAQRLALESDESEPIEARERARTAWLGRLGDLGVDAEIAADERALLERGVGDLEEEDLDDLDGRVSTAPVLLWALGRIDARPTFASTAALDEVLAEHGLLGDGSVARARSAAEAASLRDEDAVASATRAYEKTRGMARETDDPEKIFAELAADELAWVLGEE